MATDARMTGRIVGLAIIGLQSLIQRSVFRTRVINDVLTMHTLDDVLIMRKLLARSAKHEVALTANEAQLVLCLVHARIARNLLVQLLMRDTRQRVPRNACMPNHLLCALAGFTNFAIRAIAHSGTRSIDSIYRGRYRAVVGFPLCPDICVDRDKVITFGEGRTSPRVETIADANA